MPGWPFVETNATEMARSSVYPGPWTYAFVSLIDPFIKSSQVDPQSQREATISAATNKGILAEVSAVLVCVYKIEHSPLC